MTEIASRAVAAMSHFEVKKDRLAQNQDGAWKVTFTTLELPAHIIAAHPGTRYVMALVEIGDDEEPVNPKDRTGASDRAKAHYDSSSPEEQAVIRSAILAKEPEFQRWCGAEDETQAATFIRQKCRVHSRAHIAEKDYAFKAYIEMERQYKNAARSERGQ